MAKKKKVVIKTHTKVYYEAELWMDEGELEEFKDYVESDPRGADWGESYIDPLRHASHSEDFDGSEAEIEIDGEEWIPNA